MNSGLGRPDAMATIVKYFEGLLDKRRLWAK
jgi:hypothetical protein